MSPNVTQTAGKHEPGQEEAAHILHLPDRIPHQEPLSGVSSVEAYVRACSTVATGKDHLFMLRIAQGRVGGTTERRVYYGM